MQLVKSGKNATHITKHSKAYAYRRVMDQLCVKTYQEQDVLEAILSLLHAGHSGIAKTYKTATELYYWHSMKADIEKSVAIALPAKPSAKATRDRRWTQ